MNFLAPLFFLGLAALSVPIIIHLIQRERKEPIEFPSLMFLRQVPYKSVRRRKIRNVLLFAMRCLALLLLVLAFTRPYRETDTPLTAGLGDARELVILLDRSYSMAYEGRWNAAVTAARAAVQRVNPADKATLVYFDGGAVGVNQATAERARLLSALDTVKPGSGVTRYGTALKLAQGILAASELPKGEVVLISDFQRWGWDGDASAKLPGGAVLTPVNVGSATASNVTVTGVTLRREQVQERERVIVSARFANRNEQPVRGLPVTLEINGREVQKKTVDLPASDAASIAFDALTLMPETMKGSVRIRPDALTPDDAFHFAISAEQSISVLLVNGGRSESGLYLRRALEVDQARSFKVDERAFGELRNADLAGRSVVILNDAPFPTGDLGQRMRVFLEHGGGIILLTGDHAGANGWGAASDLLPGTPDRPVERTAGGGVLGSLQYGHRVFEIFNAPRSGDFTTARFFKYRPLALETDEGVLARYDDGGPALVERRVGTGRVLVWTSTFDNDWNDLPLQPVFLPFVHQLVRHASGQRDPNPWFTVGQVIDPGRVVHGEPAAEDTAASAGVGGPELSPGRSWLAITPTGQRVQLQGGGLLKLEEQGFYEVRPARGEEGKPFTVAVNLDLRESDLASMEPEALVAAVQQPEAATRAMTKSGPLTAEERERRQRFWWYLLMAAFLLLLAETTLSNRLSRVMR
jgi:hypothetical protein